LGDDGVDAPHEHLLGVAAGADGRHAHRAGVVDAGDGVLGRGAGERDHAHAFPDGERDAVVEIGLVCSEVDSERLVGALLHVAHGGAQLVVGHRDGGEDAEAPGRARRGGEARAGHPAHAGLHDRPFYAGQRAEPRVQGAVRQSLTSL
jgi:hypothetical protein